VKLTEAIKRYTEATAQGRRGQWQQHGECAQPIDAPDPTRCAVCGQYRTMDAAYSGRRCCCADGPFVAWYYQFCKVCERDTCVGCVLPEPEPEGLSPQARG
jgi:hypothetical protein